MQQYFLFIVVNFFAYFNIHAIAEEKVAIKIQATEMDQKSIALQPTDISFNLDKTIFSGVQSNVVDASPLENPDDKPDGVEPRHVAFGFLGNYADQHKGSEFEPKIAVYFLDDFKKMYAVNPESADAIDKETQELKKIINGDLSAWQGDFPYLPFIDATQEFRLQTKKIQFQGGKGVVFLTQYSIEPSLVHNQNLVYIFQGITDDGRYYVLAEFPVATEIAAKSREATTHDGYTLPLEGPLYSESKDTKEFSDYEAYRARITEKLKNLSRDKFNPSLDRIDSMLETISIGDTQK